MLVLSYIFLFIASLLMAWLLSISQIGPNWEIPIKIIQKGNFALVFSTLFLVLSLIFSLISKSKFIKLGNGTKYTFIIWLVVVTIILIFGWSKLIYQMPAISQGLSLLISNLFYPGIIVSIILLGLLIFMSRKA